jgi:hypothetical protein
MWPEKLQYNINSVPTQYLYWVRKVPVIYTEEQKYVLEISKRLWLKEISEFVNPELKQYLAQSERLQITEIWSDYFVSKFLDAGWKVIPVNGIISQKVFFELLQLEFLPIAVNIRTIDYLKDATIVDFIHDFFQFYRVLFDTEFSEFLKTLGRVGSSVIFNTNDVKINRVLKSVNRMKYNYPLNSDNVKIEQLRLLQTQKQAIDEPLSEAGKLINFYYKTLKLGVLKNGEYTDLVGNYWNLSFFDINEKLNNTVKKHFNLEELLTHFDYLFQNPAVYYYPSFAYLTVLLEKFEQTLTVNKDTATILKSVILSDFPVKLTLDEVTEVSSNFIDLEKYKINNTHQLIIAKGIGTSRVTLQGNEIYNSQDGFDLLYFTGLINEKDIYNNLQIDRQQLHFQFSDIIKIDATIETIFESPKTHYKIFKVKDCYIYLDEKIIFHKKYLIPFFNKITDIKPIFTESVRNPLKNQAEVSQLSGNSNSFELFKKIKNGNTEKLSDTDSWLIDLVHKIAS